MCKLGLLTNYDVFIVILRLSSDTVTLSSPVIRKEISRNSLPANLANDTSVFDLLLALLLFTGKPQRLDAINSGLWVGLYVRKPNEDRPTHTKRKGREKESGNKKRKTGEGEGGPSGFEDGRGDSGANDHDHGGEKLLEGGYQMERRRERPRRSDESGLSLGDTSIPSLRDPDTSSFTQGSNEDQKIITPTSATFDLNLNQSSSLFSGEPSSFLSDPKSGTNTRFGPVLHLDYQPSGRPLAVEDVEFLTSTEWYPVIPSTLAEEERVVIDRLITHGEYFKTFSARSSSDQDSLIAHSYSTDHPLSSRSTASDVSMTSHPTANDHPLPSPFLSSHQLIIKLAYLRHPRHHEELHLASGPEIAQAAEAECRILSGPLRDLQGERVPRLSGMWRSRDGIWGLTILGKVDGRQLGEGEALEEGEL